MNTRPDCWNTIGVQGEAGRPGLAAPVRPRRRAAPAVCVHARQGAR